MDHHKRPDVLRNDLIAKRDIDGIDISRKEQIDTSDYAEEYRERASFIRNKFNLQENGTFKGGVPAQFKGKVR